MARPTKFNAERAESICEAIRSGATRTAAVGANGISLETLDRWAKRFAGFAESLTRAEAEAETTFTEIIRIAAGGWDVREQTTTTKQVIERRKTTQEDGSIVDEPVVMELVTTAVVERREFDWRAAESWLKRLRRGDWGDSIDVRKLSDDQLIRLLGGPAVAGSQPPGTVHTGRNGKPAPADDGSEPVGALGI